MSPLPHIKLFAAISADPTISLSHATDLLAEVFGSVDYVGEPHSVGMPLDGAAAEDPSRELSTESRSIPTVEGVVPEQLHANRCELFTDATHISQQTCWNRWLISFTGPHYADILSSAKRACMELERGCSLELLTESHSIVTQPGSTELTPTVLIDIGYLDLHKAVLARTKDTGWGIYLDDGIFGDIIAYHRDMAWHSFPPVSHETAWEYYGSELSAIRSLFARTHTVFNTADMPTTA